MSGLNELIKYIKVLEAEPFTGWTGDNKRGYLTACTSIKKKAEKLAENIANGTTKEIEQCNLPVVRQRALDWWKYQGVRQGEIADKYNRGCETIQQHQIEEIYIKEVGLHDA